jgi:hypothetical protein
LRRLVLAVAAAVGAAGFLSAEGNDGTMNTVEIELIVDDALRARGGTVFVSILHLTPEVFGQRYAVAGDTGRQIARIRLSDPVSFVEIQTPGSDYVYRFVPDPAGPAAGTTIDQRSIGDAGAGALYIDAVTNAPVESPGGRDHHIFGSTMTLADSIGVQSNSLDLRVDPATCRVEGPVRVCPARQDEVDRLLVILRQEQGQ